jgi:SAM-dependent methyltransferase
MPGRHDAREAHFDRLYAASEDPWHYRTSTYEDAKYRATLAALGRPTYRSALEIGCSNGELSARIAPLCRRLVALDLSARAVALARQRLARHGHAEVQQATIPADWPEGRFDLIVFSEVLYYLDRGELEACAARMAASLAGRGEVVLVNWRGKTGTPLSGREAAGIFMGELCRRRKVRIRSQAREGYDLVNLVATGGSGLKGPARSPRAF